MSKMLFDYHTHTVYSRHHHGKGTIEENVMVAVEKGLSAIAITDHGPGHLFYGVKRKCFPEIRTEINRLRKKYPMIKIYMGVEANIIDTAGGLDVIKEDIEQLDFVIAGYHFGVTKGHCIGNWLWSHGILKGEYWRRRMEKVNTAMTLRAIEKNNIKILTHPGDKGPVDMEALAKACEEKGVLMEISTHHSHLTVEEIAVCKNYSVEFVISSDAHVPKMVGTFQAGVERAQKAGLDLHRIVNIKGD